MFTFAFAILIAMSVIVIGAAICVISYQDGEIRRKTEEFVKEDRW